MLTCAKKALQLKKLPLSMGLLTTPTLQGFLRNTPGLLPLNTGSLLHAKIVQAVFSLLVRLPGRTAIFNFSYTDYPVIANLLILCVLSVMLCVLRVTKNTGTQRTLRITKDTTMFK